MKTRSLTMILLFSFITQAQSTVYENKMKEALQLLYKSQNSTDYALAANTFERIANVEKKEWLPLYYNAYATILISMMNPTAEAAVRDAHLDKVSETIAALITLVPEETEIYVLQAFYFTARLVINPMVRGQEYGALSAKAIQKSLKLDPKNPRAKQMHLSSRMGTARFFGKDISSFCEEANSIIAEWDAYKTKSKWHPNWGKNQVLRIIGECNKSDRSEVKEKEKTHTITIIIEGLKSAEGKIMLQLKNEDEKIITQINEGVMEESFTTELKNIPPGTYGIRFYHDQNENQKMDSNRFGIPMESYGHSNNVKGFMGPPDFKKTLFLVNKNKTIQLIAR